MIRQEHIDRAAELAARFKKGQKLTVFAISEAMANTTKREILITDTDIDQKAIERYVDGPIDSYRVATYKERGKRKQYYLDIRVDALVFEGWDLPIKRDWEVAADAGGFSFSGNACYNLAGQPDTIRDYVENRNLNGPTSDSVKSKIVLIVTDAQGKRIEGNAELLLYPQIETSHAVVNRIKDKLEEELAEFDNSVIV